MLKPMLAMDVNENKLKFPLGIMPKIDGCYTMVQDGVAYARSLKQHENLHFTKLYSSTMLNGIRAEAILGADPAADGLCRNTSGALRRINGEEEFSLFCFDYVTEETKDLPYSARYELLQNIIATLQELRDDIHIIRLDIVNNLQEYLDHRQQALASGFEGVILRDLTLPYKEGRSSSTKAHTWRWKPFKDNEGIVVQITEGTTNNNPAETNELGRTKRSTHQGNLTPNGTVGSIQVKLLQDLVEVSGKVIMKAGEGLTVSSGEMPAKERKFYFENQQELLGKIIKFSWFAYGCKTLPRYPNFVSIRNEVDM